MPRAQKWWLCEVAERKIRIRHYKVNQIVSLQAPSLSYSKVVRRVGRRAQEQESFQTKKIWKGDERDRQRSRVQMWRFERGLLWGMRDRFWEDWE